MDKPLDPATPFKEVYQHFLRALARHSRKDTTRHKYAYDHARFEHWLRATGWPATIASMMDQDVLFDYRHFLETLPQQPRGSKRRRRGEMMSNQTVHSYLKSTKCLASWLQKNGYISVHPFLAADAYFKEEGVMPVLHRNERIPKIARPFDVRLLLQACAGDKPEDLRDRAIIWTVYSHGIRTSDASNLTVSQVDFATGILTIEDGKGDKGCHRMTGCRQPKSPS